MKPNQEKVPTPPRAAATVVLLRDAPGGLEVLMLRRHGESEVLGGAFVFPGGKLDPADSQPETIAHLDLEPQRMHDSLGEPDVGAEIAAGLFAAAMRETCEEAGILLSPEIAPEEAAAFGRRLREGVSFAEALARSQLRLAASAMLPWSRWITPIVPSMTNKRFDTRFFVAQVPAGLEARHDEHEATESLWISPRAALERYWERQIVLAPPQIQSLAHLARHGRVEDVFAEARRRRPPVIRPEPFDVEGIRVIAYPGDERHPVRERALPGPTRLAYREGRFEPDGGFEAFFG